MSEPFKIPMPPGVERVETGAIQFGDDWPSVHIRGDNAFNYAMHLKEVIEKCDLHPGIVGEIRFSLMILRGLLDDLQGCVVKPKS
jgi:hypothetical protein